MGLFDSLNRLLGGIPANFVNNVEHPMNVVHNALSGIAPITRDIKPLYQQYGPLPSITTNASRVYAYTPEFQNLIRQNPASSPRVLPNAEPGAIAQWSPHQINYLKNQANSTSYTHELLHAAYSTKTPDQQANFLKMAQNSINSPERAWLSAQLNQPAYGNYQLPPDITTVPQRIATEIHSYLPQASEVTYSGMSPAQGAYYQQYFSNPTPGPQQPSGSGGVQ